LVFDNVLRDLLHCLWRVGLVATSPTRWEACLLWMSHDPVIPAWGHSVNSQFVGKLGCCSWNSWGSHDAWMPNASSLCCVHVTARLLLILKKFKWFGLTNANDLQTQTFRFWDIHVVMSITIMTPLFCLNKLCKQNPHHSTCLHLPWHMLCKIV